MSEEEEECQCSRCGRKLTRAKYEGYDSMCEECYEIEVDEMDYEDDY